jgi:hypothetical protein
MVAISRSAPFEVDSSVVRLGSAGRRTIALRFSKRQLSRLRSALRAHRRVSATIHGVLLNPPVYSVLHDPGRSIERETRGAKLAISS